MTTEGETALAYEELLDQYGRVVNLAGASLLLSWDQQVMMPTGGTPARSKQLATLSRTRHEILTDDRIGALLDELDGSDTTASQQAVLREIRREYDRAVSVPHELIEEIAEVSANAHPVWIEAREQDDFGRFEPILERLVELRREYAAAIDPDDDPYAVLFADYEPYLSLETADTVLTTLRDALVPLIESIDNVNERHPVDAFDGTFDRQTQDELVRETLDRLGYDWDRGRMDTAPHPFSTGTQFDARVTTRFDESDVLSAVSSTIHEFGHAHYTLGLPQDSYGTPLGQSRDLSVHESQSRLWENHIGRSRAFWTFFLPVMQEYFPDLSSVSVEDAYRSANQVFTDNLIRVEADELTYHLHIVIRYEIERALVRGDIEVADVPTVWNDKYDEYLGIRPDSDADGCLQDIHWSNGAIGYFPTYSLGSVLAAQLWAGLERDLGDLNTIVQEGRFEAITEWLRDRIHRHGCRYTTPDLVEIATDEPYTAEYFVDYATSKYGTIYGL